MDLKQTRVRILIGASAYACITECGVNTDIKLAPGRKASTSLREYAEVQRARAACITANAELAERAAMVLDKGEAERIAKIK